MQNYVKHLVPLISAPTAELRAQLDQIIPVSRNIILQLILVQMGCHVAGHVIDPQEGNSRYVLQCKSQFKFVCMYRSRATL